jgi:hypothetical protein
MKMVSMANKPEEKKEGGEMDCCDDAMYPYGTQISLGSDQLKALGVMELPKVGAVLKVMASVKVVACRAEEDKDGEEDLSCSLQITEMGIDSKMSESAIASTMYDGK